MYSVSPLALDAVCSLQGWGLLRMLKLCLILPGEQAGPLAEQFALTPPARLPATPPYRSVPCQRLSVSLTSEATKAGLDDSDGKAEMSALQRIK